MVAPMMKLDEEEFYKWKDSVLKSEVYQKVVSKRVVKDLTKVRYVLSLATYCMYNNMSLDELIKEADEEERKGVRVKDRKILERLEGFRPWLLDQGLGTLTTRTRFNDAKWFYKQNYIQVPDLAGTFKYPHEYKLSFEDLPTREDIKKAVDGTIALSNKALFLFMASSGSAKMETSTLTVKSFINATKEYHGGISNIDDVLRILDGRGDVVPLFKMHREKTDYDYYTCCSPEASQAIIDLLLSQPIVKEDDPLFYLSYGGIGKAFQRANHKHNWGKVKNYYYFSGHRLRKRHASLIENENLANFLQGRKPDKIQETYFFNRPERVKEEYLKHVNKLTINEMNYKDIYSEEYQELLEENRRLQEQVDAQYQEIVELNATNKALVNRVENVESRMDNLAKANELTKFQEIASNHPLVLNNPGLMEVATELYLDSIEFKDIKYVSDAEVGEIIQTAYLTMKVLKDSKSDGVVDEKRLETEYGERYRKVTKSIEIFKQMFINDLDFPLEKSLNDKINVALSKFKEDVLVNNKSVSYATVENVIHQALGLDEKVGHIIGLSYEPGTRFNNLQ